MGIAEVSTLTVAGGVAVLKIDFPPVNALGHAVRVALYDGVEAAIANPEVAALVILCSGRTFFAGADIGEFGKPVVAPDLNDLFRLMENSPRLLIAAIHGAALGGGCELALACDYRVAMASAKLGLPEVTLGLVPGAGGTQRLPRLAGVALALDLMTSGRSLDAVAAYERGLIDELVTEGALEKAAGLFARKLIANSAPRRRVRDLKPDLDVEATTVLLNEFRKRNRRLFTGFKAPDYILRAIEAAASLPFDAGLAREKELFDELLASGESAAQRYIFFAERTAAKVPWLIANPPILPVQSVAVIGAGTMGRGIATAFLNAGLAVTLIDCERAAVDNGAEGIRKTLNGMVDKGRLTPADAKQRNLLFQTGLDIRLAATADLVIEAVYENLDLKKSVFRQIDAVAKPNAILASNTSFLDMEAIAAATDRPRQVVGLHFFAPANIMRLLEVVRCRETSDSVAATAMTLGRKLGKIAVLSGVCHGFIANRMMTPRGEAADRLILEGPLPTDVDRVMTDYGFPMGPFAMLDLVGLDVIGWDRDSSTGRTVQEVLCESGRCGQKKGGGYYDYDERRRPVPSPAAEEAIRHVAAKTGVPQVSYTSAQMLERLLYPVVNEGAKILEEGIALRASDIDVALVAGYGWPVYTGGPMFWADAIGLDRIVESLQQRQVAVSPLLLRLAGARQRFTER
jgi:3-hydroxyacyl-CoA dehydrogenase